MNRFREIYKNYEQFLFKDDILLKEKRIQLEKRKIRMFEEQYARFLPEDKDAAILDIGCGWGQFLFFLNHKGYRNLLGIDLVQKPIDFINKYGIKAEKISSLKEFQTKSQIKFDFISMIYVLEQMPKEEIISNLRSIKELLKEDGRALIVTINMANLTGPSMLYNDFAQECGFTDRSLKQVINGAGFSDVEIMGSKLILTFNLRRLLWVLANIIWHKILAALYILERGLDRPGIMSLNLIAYIKK